MNTTVFTKRLMKWYGKNKRNLPWRHTKDPYKIWISEIMLQQTTVNAVIPFYKKWVNEFPSVYDVAKAPLQKILKMWQGLGYYSRARNIHKSAQIICNIHQGKIPQDPKELRKLPGFGPYSVGAVLSIAFDQRQPIVDANVRRVIMRQLAIEGLADTSQDEKILPYLDKVMPLKGNNIFNQALMEIGALVCKSRNPLCLLCPVMQSCLAFEKGIQEIIPTPQKKIIKEIDAVIAVIKNKEKYYIQKRSSKGLLADLWEFPGGKIEEGESAKDALYREAKEEIGVDVASAKHLMNINHFYTEYKVKLNVWECRLKAIPLGDKTHKWVSLKNLAKYPMPSGSVKIVEKLESLN